MSQPLLPCSVLTRDVTCNFTVNNHTMFQIHIQVFGSESTFQWMHTFHDSIRIYGTLYNDFGILFHKVLVKKNNASACFTLFLVQYLDSKSTRKCFYMPFCVYKSTKYIYTHIPTYNNHPLHSQDQFEGKSGSRFFWHMFTSRRNY